MIMVIVKVAVMWRKRSDAGVDDGFNNRLGEAPVGGSDQASGHTNSVSDAVEFRYLLTVRYAHSSREQGRGSGISWFRGEPSATPYRSESPILYAVKQNDDSYHLQTRHNTAASSRRFRRLKYICQDVL
jgi:hypothetical protein